MYEIADLPKIKMYVCWNPQLVSKATSARKFNLFAFFLRFLTCFSFIFRYAFDSFNNWLHFTIFFALFAILAWKLDHLCRNGQLNITQLLIELLNYGTAQPKLLWGIGRGASMDNGYNTLLKHGAGYVKGTQFFYMWRNKK